MGDSEQVTPPEVSRPQERRRGWRRLWPPVLLVLAVYLLAAYVLAPGMWKYVARHRPAFDGIPNLTSTGSGIPGDPLNVGLIGSETDVKTILLAAKWYPADPLTLRSCLEIAAATVLDRRYNDAPVSNLYLFGRKEDLAFEEPVGKDPKQRHHVRLWHCDQAAPDGRSMWIGAATFDTRVGFSHTTGQITHHIASDVDAERDHLFRCLELTGHLVESYFVDDFHTNRQGRNGGGDPWRTDGRLAVGVVAGP